MTASFVYDGDGNRVLGVVNGVTSIYVGDHYELEIDGAAQTTRLYYAAAGQRVAVRTNGTLTYLLGDHLGSTTLAVTAQGTLASEQRYTAFGQTRYAMGDLPTTYEYTGQRNEALIGLYYYRARWYDPALGRFVQADTMVPSPGNPLAWDRYAYVLNNPLRFSDPTGHDRDCGMGDSYCSQLRREYHYSPLRKVASFRTYLRVEDARHALAHKIDRARREPLPPGQEIARDLGGEAITGIFKHWGAGTGWSGNIPGQLPRELGSAFSRVNYGGISASNALKIARGFAVVGWAVQVAPAQRDNLDQYRQGKAVTMNDVVGDLLLDTGIYGASALSGMGAAAFGGLFTESPPGLILAGAGGSVGMSLLLNAYVDANDVRPAFIQYLEAASAIPVVHYGRTGMPPPVGP